MLAFLKTMFEIKSFINIFKILSPIVWYCFRLSRHSANIVNIVNISIEFRGSQGISRGLRDIKRSQFYIYHQYGNCQNREDLQKCQGCTSSTSISTNFWTCTWWRRYMDGTKTSRNIGLVLLNCCSLLDAGELSPKKDEVFCYMQWQSDHICVHLNKDKLA